jgi:translation initiation factor IF-2
MADQPSIRLNKVLRELNISLDRAVEFLAQKGVDVEARPTTKITKEVYTTLLDEFETDKSKKVASHEISEEKRKEKEDLRVIQEKKEQDRLDQIAKQ